MKCLQIFTVNEVVPTDSGRFLSPEDLAQDPLGI